MNRKLRLAAGAFVMMLVIGSLAACKKTNNSGGDGKGDGEHQYGVMLMIGAWPNTTYYILEVPSLMEGKADLNGRGVNVSTIVGDQGMIQRDGFYYYFNRTNSRLGKYHIAGDQLITDKEVPFTAMASVSSHIWIDAETLVLFGTDGESNELLYAEVNTTGMQVSGGTLNVPAITETGYPDIAPGFAEYRNGKIFLGYGYAAEWPGTPLPKVLVAVVDYPSMNVSSVLTDTRSAWPGGPSRYAPTSFQDEKGDIYFTTVPDNGNDYDGGSSIYRIKNGSNVLDPNYYFDFSATVDGNTAQAIWYLGNGEAIIRARIPADRANPDFYYKWDSYFAVVNVQNGTLVKKLDLATDIGEIYVQAVVVEDGKGYIMLNDANKKGYMWEYDPATGKLTKGLEFAEGYDYLLRVDKWK